MVWVVVVLVWAWLALQDLRALQRAGILGVRHDRLLDIGRRYRANLVRSAAIIAGSVVLMMGPP